MSDAEQRFPVDTTPQLFTEKLKINNYEIIFSVAVTHCKQKLMQVKTETPHRRWRKNSRHNTPFDEPHELAKKTLSRLIRKNK
jgi:hypothetical protein